jgi:hypothetical protein
VGWHGCVLLSVCDEVAGSLTLDICVCMKTSCEIIELYFCVECTINVLLQLYNCVFVLTVVHHIT